MTAGETLTASGNPSRSGHTRITHTALRKTLEAVTAQAFGVDAGAVAVELADDRGLLGVAATVKLMPPPLRNRHAGPTMFERSHVARAAITDHGFALTGMMLGRVDIRLTAAKRASKREGRVQ
ncbi:MAG TPA: hypothetical protein VJP90_05360 [Paenarthrobacter sp.]|nr:hypothetical protein [Paenarthrobacter sp.]